MRLIGRRQVLIGVLLFLLGAAMSQGAAALIAANQGGDSIGMVRQHALEVAAQIDDQRLFSIAADARFASSSNDHQMLGVVARQGASFTDAVGSMASALGSGARGIAPDWFYSCFGSTVQITRSSVGILQSAAGATVWSGSQADAVRQTLNDLDTASRDLDMVVTGGQLSAGKSPFQSVPNGLFTSQATCDRIQELADTLSQRQWPA